MMTTTTIYRFDFSQFVSRLVDLSNVVSTGTAKHHQIQQRVSSQSVSSMHRHAGSLTSSPQARDNSILVILRLNHLQQQNDQKVTR